MLHYCICNYLYVMWQHLPNFHIHFRLLSSVSFFIWISNRSFKLNMTKIELLKSEQFKRPYLKIMMVVVTVKGWGMQLGEKTPVLPTGLLNSFTAQSALFTISIVLIELHSSHCFPNTLVLLRARVQLYRKDNLLILLYY